MSFSRLALLFVALALCCLACTSSGDRGDPCEGNTLSTVECGAGLICDERASWTCQPRSCANGGLDCRSPAYDAGAPVADASPPLDAGLDADAEIDADADADADAD